MSQDETAGNVCRIKHDNIQAMLKKVRARANKIAKSGIEDGNDWESVGELGDIEMHLSEIFDG